MLPGRGSMVLSKKAGVSYPRLLSFANIDFIYAFRLALTVRPDSLLEKEAFFSAAAAGVTILLLHYRLQLVLSFLVGFLP